MLDYLLEKLINHSTILRKKANVSIRISYLILLGVHFCVILWLLVGTRQAMSDDSVPWIKKNLEIESYDNYQQYVLSIYWIFTLVTTVGYGDFYGSTTLEYFISILFEFGGFIVLAGVFWLMVQLLEPDYDFSTCLSEKQTCYEHWLSQLEKSNSNLNICPTLLIKVRKSLEDAFIYDFNMIIEEFEMYKHLTSQLQIKISN
jgi:hypothetical protein